MSFDKEQERRGDTCASCGERLPDYVAGYLQDDERRAVERHVRSCARCSAELREWEAIRQANLTVAGAPHPQRAFAVAWSELHARLSPADSVPSRSHKEGHLMDTLPSPRADRHPPAHVDSSPSRRTWLSPRMRGLAATAFAAATVAALVAVFVALAPDHRFSSPAGPDGNATSERGRWIDLTALDLNTSFSSNDQPAIAPMNPLVVYETLAGNYQAQAPASMRRTDDGGKAWHTLPLPVAANHVGHLGVAVSPLDAHTVFLTVFDDTAGDCPANRTQRNTEASNGSVFCWLQYTSTDGGQHWKTTTLPLAGGTQAGVLNASTGAGGVSAIFSGSLHALGSQLYAGFGCVVSVCSRLVTSADGGLTWRFADEQIAGLGGATCDYAVARETKTLFATTAPTDCSSRQQKPLTLWRSDDDTGSHWIQVGTLPTPNDRGMVVTTDASSGKHLLYAALPRTTGTNTDKMGNPYPIFSADATDLKVSADDGKTWEDAPSAGIPADMSAANYGTGMASILGTLHDGSVVVEFIAQSARDPFSGGILFAWKRGDPTWRQIAPPLTQEIGSMLAVRAKENGQQDTLYLVMINRGGTGDPSPTFRFLRYVP